MSQLTKSEEPAAVAGRIEYLIPAVNLLQDSEGFTLEAEMPGVRKEGLEITFDEGKLTLAGHRSAQAAAGKTVYAESSSQAYRRVFDLDPSIDAEKIQATIEQGLLTVRLPKAEASKPRRIAVA